MPSLKQHARAYSQMRIETIEMKKQEREHKIKEDMKSIGYFKNKSSIFETLLQEEKRKEGN